MKFVTVLTFAFCTLLLSSGAWAADPECVGITSQPAAVDYSDGSGTLCSPENFSDGTPIEASRTFSCQVEFFDKDGASMGTQTFTGGPATRHDFTVPRDGMGSAVASCNMDGLVSSNRTVAVTYPAAVAVEPPTLLLIP